MREVGGAPRNPAPRNHSLVWIVKPSGYPLQNAFGGKTYRRVPIPLRSTSPFSKTCVTGFSGKTLYREMRGFVGREKSAAIWSVGHCKPAACILGLTEAKCAAFPEMRISLMIWSSEGRGSSRPQGFPADVQKTGQPALTQRGKEVP